MKKTISYVIPCYNSEMFIETTVNDLIQHITNDLPNYEYEIILVNDCHKYHIFISIFTQTNIVFKGSFYIKSRIFI